MEWRVHPAVVDFARAALNVTAVAGIGDDLRMLRMMAVLADPGGPSSTIAGRLASIASMIWRITGAWVYATNILREIHPCSARLRRLWSLRMSRVTWIAKNKSYSQMNCSGKISARG